MSRRDAQGAWEGPDGGRLVEASSGRGARRGGGALPPFAPWSVLHPLRCAVGAEPFPVRYPSEAHTTQMESTIAGVAKEVVRLRPRPHADKAFDGGGRRREGRWFLAARRGGGGAGWRPAAAARPGWRRLEETLELAKVGGQCLSGRLERDAVSGVPVRERRSEIDDGRYDVVGGGGLRAKIGREDKVEGVHNPHRSGGSNPDAVAAVVVEAGAEVPCFEAVLPP